MCGSCPPLELAPVSVCHQTRVMIRLLVFLKLCCAVYIIYKLCCAVYIIYKLYTGKTVLPTKKFGQYNMTFYEL